MLLTTTKTLLVTTGTVASLLYLQQTVHADITASTPDTCPLAASVMTSGTAVSPSATDTSGAGYFSDNDMGPAACYVINLSPAEQDLADTVASGGDTDDDEYRAGGRTEALIVLLAQDQNAQITAEDGKYSSTKGFDVVV